jgi:hypothetical protein
MFGLNSISTYTVPMIEAGCPASKSTILALLVA